MISKAIQNANDEAKKRVKEQQSFDTADEHAVQIKLNGLRQFVPIGTVEVDGKPLAEHLKTAKETKARVDKLEEVVAGLRESSAEQANLLKAVVATLKGEKL